MWPSHVPTARHGLAAPGRRHRRARRTVLGGVLAAVAVVVPTVVAADDTVDPPPEPDVADPLLPPPPVEQPAPAPPSTAPTSDTPPVDPDEGGSDAPGDTPGASGGEPEAGTPPPAPVAAPGPDAAPPEPPAPVGLDITILPDRLQHVLATIRYLESRNTYDLPPNRGNASGAYQFIASTWADYGGYPHAYLAPPAVQDERAVADVEKFLARFDGDVSMVPVMWYYPRAVREPELMDVIPMPQHGNKLTIREYQTRWMEVFSELSGQPLPPVISAEEAARRAGVAPVVPEVAGRSVADGATIAALARLESADTDGDPNDPTTREVALSFPVLGPSRLASLDCANDTALEPAVVRVVRDGHDVHEITPARARSDAERAGLCTEHAPGVVFGVKLQPVLAAADGVVTAVDDDPDSDRPISVVVTATDGTSIEYRGFNDDSPGTDDGNAPDHLRLSPLARVGEVVRAGQVLGFMGDSDPLPPTIRADVPTDSTQRLDPDAIAPHIRLTVTDANGDPIDAVGPLLDARARESCRVGIGGWSMPPGDEPVEAVVVETTDLHPGIDSQWVITWTGQVQASGWAAMINPVELCAWVPEETFGPGAAGSPVGLFEWLLPYELPTELWVELVLRDETTPEAFVRPG